MVTRDDIREFLTSRRVAGLRREEVAQLARISVDDNTRLERGGLAGVSESVLESLARALRHVRARAHPRARADLIRDARPASGAMPRPGA